MGSVRIFIYFTKGAVVSRVGSAAAVWFDYAGGRDIVDEQLLVLVTHMNCRVHYCTTVVLTSIERKERGTRLAHSCCVGSRDISVYLAIALTCRDDTS